MVETLSATTPNAAVTIAQRRFFVFFTGTLSPSRGDVPFVVETLDGLSGENVSDLV